MILIDFFNKNPALWALLGVIVTQISNFFLKKIDIDAQLLRQKIDWSWEFEKKSVIEPILTFLDSELKLMTFVYTQGFESKEADQEIKRHILDLSTTFARIKALDDYELNEKFNEFSRKRLGIGNRVFNQGEKDMEGAYQELQEAEKLAGEIIWLIKMRIRQQDKLIRNSK